MIQWIPVSEARPGMVIGKAVTNQSGILLIPQGTHLSEKHMGIFKKWGITDIGIEVSARSLDSLPALDASEQAAVEQEVGDRFIQGFASEVMQALKQFALNRRIHEARKAKESAPNG